MLYSGDNSVEYAIQITICEGCHCPYIPCMHLSFYRSTYINYTIINCQSA